jgi:hypothetical protein
MFDNTNAPSWELLRFRPEFAAAPGFERALSDRVEQLGHFKHPLFTHVRAVEELGFGDGLALVATYAPGRRLSEALVRPRSVGAVIPLIRQLTSALADLQEQGGDVAHGALTADRIMVARDGRLIIREHASARRSRGFACRRAPLDRPRHHGVADAPRRSDARSPYGRRPARTRGALTNARPARRAGGLSAADRRSARSHRRNDWR